MSTPAYFAPYIDSAGLHLPGYASILQYEENAFSSVFGQSVSNTDDGADEQWISIFSLLINDAFNTAQLAVNARSPVTAIGADLDSICKINGLARNAASSSTAVLTIVGTPGTVLTNCVAQDINNYLWDLPISFTIPNTGTINVTATCETLGAIAAAPNTINIRSTPTSGWTSVNNASAAALGLPQESDSQLRARQALSVSLPSKTLVAGTLAGIAAVTNVSRYNQGQPTPGGPGTSVENPTGGVDSWGNPAHSISMVVEGGADLDVATAIYNNKCPGCLTNGTTPITVTDPVSGASMVISFFRPTYIPIYVILNVHGLTGYNSAVQSAIQLAVTNYLNALQIGESITISGLYAAAMAVMPNILLPQFSVQSLYAAITPTPTTSVDIAINFNAVAQGTLANIIVNNV
jgi:uncharacterized phage protein gp47/JayE